MEKIPFVFIDTCVFEQLGYNFESDVLRALTDLTNEHSITLLLPEIIEDEISSHMAKKCVEAVTQLVKSANLRGAPFLYDCSSWPLEPIDEARELKLIDELQRHARDKFEQFLSRLPHARIPYRAANLDTVFYRYHNKIAPFQDGKKSEFPDAVAISCLENHCQKESKVVAVVSRDKGFLDGCAASSLLVTFDAIGEAMESLLNRPEEVEAAKNKIRDNLTVLFARLSFRLHFNQFLHKRYQLSMIGRPELGTPTLTDLNVIAISGNQAVMTFEVSVPYMFQAEYKPWTGGFLLEPRETPEILETHTGIFEGVTKATGTAKVDMNSCKGEIEYGAISLDSWTFVIDSEPRSKIEE